MPFPDPSSPSFEVMLRGGIDAGRVAREALAEHSPGLPQSVMEDVSLLVTELVSNAVCHVDGSSSHEVQFAFRWRYDTIRVEVTDIGTGFQKPARPTTGDAHGGWGLFLVDRIATRWGVKPAPAGTCVWFELAAAA